MKFLLSIFILQCLVFNINCIRIKDPTVLFQFSEDAVSFEPSPTHKFTNAQICEGLVDFLRLFGTSAASKYGNCQEKYWLLGDENSMIKKDRPSCYLDLVPVFCQYRIDTDIHHPHPSDIRYFITKTIQNCIRTHSEYDDDETYICPSLNFETKQIEHKEEFCKHLEAINKYEPDNAFSDPLYKVYGFIGKDAEQRCIEIVELYNFCIFATVKLNLDSERCFTNKFTLYEDGGTVQSYGIQDQKICSSHMLPYFSYNSLRENILEPMNSFGFCDGINHRIIVELNDREEAVKAEISHEEQELAKFEANIEKLNTLKTNASPLVEQVTKLEEKVNFLYKTLTNSETVNATNVTIIIKNNIDLLNDTVADWVMTSRSSLEYMKAFSSNGSLLDDLDKLTNNFAKIFLLSKHANEFASFTGDLLIKAVDDKAAENMISEKEDNTIFKDNLQQERVIFYEGKSNYQDFITKLLNQTSIEIQANQDKADECKRQIEILKTTLDALYEQEKISYQYFT